MSDSTRRLLSSLFALAVLGGCSSAEPPAHEPAAEEEPVGAPRPAAPEATSPEQAEIEAERRMEEAIERVRVAEPSPPAQDGSVLEILFDAGAAALGQEARASLDGMYERLLAEATDFYLEIQGHSDPTGSEAANRRLAEQRAEVVREYLHREWDVPLERMGVTAHGSAVPVAYNHTSTGREQNRRVVVVVLLPP